MDKVSHIIIGFCVFAVAASLGIILFVKGGFDLPESILTVVSVILIIAVVQIGASRSQERARLNQEVRDLMRANEALAEKLEQTDERIEELDGLDIRMESVGTRMQERILGEVDDLIEDRVAQTKSALVGEMQVIENLVKQVATGISKSTPTKPQSSTNANSVSSSSSKSSLKTGLAELNEAKKSSPQSTIQDSSEETEPYNPLFDPSSPLAHLDNELLLDMVRSAIEHNRVDLYLQPIVTLPQRHVRYYEALTRLRDQGEDLIYPADYMRVAEPAGIMPTIDNLILFRSVQIVRRLATRDRDVGIFCNVSAHTLADPAFFPQFIDFIQHNESLKDSLIFEFSQDLIQNAGSIELASMSALADLGFSFSLDHVQRLDIDPRELSSLNFKFVKVNSSLLLNDAEAAGAKIHPADLADLLKRFGIKLIAEKVEQESTIVDILDYDITMGQGFLFSEARPVRGEFLQDVTTPDYIKQAS